MPAPSRRNVLLRYHAHPCLTFNVHLWPCNYTWASIDTTSIFKTCTEVLYIVLHTSSSNMQSWLVCRLKGKTPFSPTRRVKNRQLNYERYITAAALYRWRIAYRWRIVSLLSRYSSLFINLSPFFLHNFGPERKHALLLLDETFFSGTMLTLVFRLMYIYGPTSIHGLP